MERISKRFGEQSEGRVTEKRELGKKSYDFSSKKNCGQTMRLTGGKGKIRGWCRKAKNQSLLVNAWAGKGTGNRNKRPKGRGKIG
ncbi:MAG: hypothetical protein A2426_08390 [Candidatus Lambdaproteobacteria bacterium RIFOXYC1_FULL_56_13]|nr:MAG: hypothetical protein A2426_08390 [Candidatus Lambdaproteobacteria bacterium RIFOXYC1_FULL_56_13]